MAERRKSHFDFVVSLIFYELERLFISKSSSGATSHSQRPTVTVYIYTSQRQKVTLGTTWKEINGDGERCPVPVM